MSGAQNGISYTKMAQNAVEAFKASHTPYYGTLLFTSRYLERKIQETMGPVKQAIGPRAYRHMVKQMEGKAETDQTSAEMSDKMAAVCLMEGYKKAYYTIAAEDSLARFEKAGGYGRPEAIDEAIEEIETLYRRAGMRNWSEEKRADVQERIAQAAIANHSASEDMAREALRNMGSGYSTYRDFDRVAKKIAYHAMEAGMMGEFTQKAIDAEMAAVAMKAVENRLKIYATAPRHFEQTTAGRKKEEDSIYDLYSFYGRYAQNAPSAQAFRDSLAKARNESMKRAKETAKETPVESVLMPEADRSNVVSLFAAPSHGKKIGGPGTTTGTIPDSIPNPYDERPNRTRATEQRVQMAAGTGARRDLQAH